MIMLVEKHALLVLDYTFNEEANPNTMNRFDDQSKPNMMYLQAAALAKDKVHHQSWGC